MNPTPTYKIGSEIIARHEEALISELSALYPDEGEREIVEKVLIPQFKALIEQVLEEFDAEENAVSGVVLPTDISVLCGKVDDVIGENMVLLDVDGLFKPVFERIQGVRREVANELEEEFGQKCREVLAEKGVVDRFTLLKKGPEWFLRETFQPFGKGKAFTGIILGHSIGHNLSIDDLTHVAEALGFPEQTSESLMQTYLNLLASKDVHDRASLINKGQAWFEGEDFQPFGKGRSFAGVILNTTTRRISIDVLNQIADTLSLPFLCEESKKTFRSIFIEKGVTDKVTLLNKGLNWFKAQSYTPFGRVKSLIKAISGVPIRNITGDTMRQIANAIDLPYLSEDSKDALRALFAANDVTDKYSLLGKGIRWFQKQSFPPYGKGTALCSAILDIDHCPVTNDSMNQVAVILELPYLSVQTKEKLKLALAENGILDRATLLNKGVNRFKNISFPPYGKGTGFANAVLGVKLKLLHKDNLSQIADVLDLPDLSEESKENFRGILAQKQIVDRASFLRKKRGWYRDENFSPFGKGLAFIKAVLGIAYKRITYESLSEVADVLFPED